MQYDRDNVFPGALLISQGAVTDIARGLYHTAPTYFFRYPGSNFSSIVAESFSSMSFFPAYSLHMKEFTRKKLYKKRLLFTKNLTVSEKEKSQEALFLNYQKNFLFFQKHFHEKFKDPIIGCYLPFKSEFDPYFLVQYYKFLGSKIAYPIVKDSQNMEFYEEEKIKNGVINFNSISPVYPHLFLVPLLAFDYKGYRLGFGKGYYDYYLNKLSLMNKKFFTIGIAYEFQKVLTIYPQIHDKALDAVLTEKQFYSF